MLTPSQKRVYDFIKTFIKENGYSPTLAEIAEGLNLRARSLVSRYVQDLANIGLIILDSGHRKIRLKVDTNPTIPILGKIAAGFPIEALSSSEPPDVISLLKNMHPNVFALQAKGDSMIDAGIRDGDYVLCEKRSRAEANEIVVALIDGTEATLKRFQPNRNGTVTLIPANIMLQPQSYSAERIQIQGVFRGLIRLK